MFLHVTVSIYIDEKEEMTIANRTTIPPEKVFFVCQSSQTEISPFNLGSMTWTALLCISHLFF